MEIEALIARIKRFRIGHSLRSAADQLGLSHERLRYLLVTDPANIGMKVKTYNKIKQALDDRNA